MHSVTSNAVYRASLSIDSQDFSSTYKVGNFTFKRIGNIVLLETNGGDWQNLPTNQFIDLFTIPEKYRPTGIICLSEQTGVKISVFIRYDGSVYVYNYENAQSAYNGYYNGCWVANN